MNNIVLYKNDFDDLVIYTYEKDNEKELKNEDAIQFLKTFEKYDKVKIKCVANDVMFNYGHDSLTVEDYPHVFSDERLDEVFDSVLGNKTTVVNSNHPKTKKVKRKNKYNTKKIITTAFIAAVLGTTAVKSIPKEADNEYIVQSNKVIDYEPVTLQENTEARDKYLQEIITRYKNTAFINYETRDEYEMLKHQNTIENYKEIIDYYSEMYGIDSNLMTAIATQERGVHSEEMDEGGATGLMQIQNDAWDNEYLSAYNFEGSNWEEVYVDTEQLKDINYNIKIGCMIFQNYLYQLDYNPIAATQAYNMGIGTIGMIYSDYCSDNGLDINETISDPRNLGWMDYRKEIPYGDQEYIEHVYSYLGDNFSIEVKKVTGETVHIDVENDKTKENNKSRI